MNLAKINFQIVEDIKKELRLQGHYLTGALENSMEPRQSITELEAFAYAYLQELEQGVPASEIPALNKGSQEFINLVKWVKLRGLNDGRLSADSIAEAIWRKWQRKGKPLESSKEFSKTGEILGAVETVFKKNEADYFAQIDEEVVLTLDKNFFQ
jgi:hypothetical protein